MIRISVDQAGAYKLSDSNIPQTFSRLNALFMWESKYYIIFDEAYEITSMIFENGTA